VNLFEEGFRSFIEGQKTEGLNKMYIAFDRNLEELSKVTGDSITDLGSLDETCRVEA
jgi:hypothetical protein